MHSRQTTALQLVNRAQARPGSRPPTRLTMGGYPNRAFPRPSRELSMPRFTARPQRLFTATDHFQICGQLPCAVFPRHQAFLDCLTQLRLQAPARKCSFRKLAFPHLQFVWSTGAAMTASRYPSFSRRSFLQPGRSPTTLLQEIWAFCEFVRTQSNPPRQRICSQTQVSRQRRLGLG